MAVFLFLFSCLVYSITGKSDNPYLDCLSYADKGARQKCITFVAHKSIEFPTSIGIVAGQIPTPWFSDDIRGRIIPTGQFPLARESVEYFYGLISARALLSGIDNPGVIAFNTYPHYVISEGDLVAGRYDTTLGNFPYFNCTVNLTFSGFYRFNDEGTQIISYDLTLTRLGLTIATINQCAGTLGEDFVCQIAEQFCVGDNQQYYSKERKDLPKCKTFLEKTEQGTFDNAMSNTRVCRRVHSLLTVVDPELHCPHIGPSGGGVCVDKPFGQYYDTLY